MISAMPDVRNIPRVELEGNLFNHVLLLSSLDLNIIDTADRCQTISASTTVFSPSEAFDLSAFLRLNTMSVATKNATPTNAIIYNNVTLSYTVQKLNVPH